MNNTWISFITIAVVILLSSCGGGNGTYTLENRPPASILEYETYSYTPTFTPPIVRNVVFTISNPPKWVDFDSATGTISGTPSQADVGTDANITIQTKIGNATLTTKSFSITVEATNLPPQISGTPEKTTYYASRSYTFTPTTYDREGSPLEFFISNIPNWISFNENTGEISAQPTIDDIGSEYEITISVSDGQSTVGLEPFTISVNPGIKTARISWTPPTKNVDGSMLTDLAGYKIYYGTETGQYDETITLNSIDKLTAYTIKNLLFPEYFFAMTAFDLHGNESEFSETVNKRID